MYLGGICDNLVINAFNAVLYLYIYIYKYKFTKNIINNYSMKKVLYVPIPFNSIGSLRLVITYL